MTKPNMVECPSCGCNSVAKHPQIMWHFSPQLILMQSTCIACKSTVTVGVMERGEYRPTYTVITEGAGNERA